MKLGKDEHRLLALWAADCAEHVLAQFEGKRPGDVRARDAVVATRAWARGELPLALARKTTFSAHEAARDAINPAARAAARAAGHAAAATHVASHALHAANYAVDAAEAGGIDPDAERAWQDEQLPDALRAILYPED
ncbi:hypothetical protein VW29_12595 [Devosia limi DSM 17137]|nr:hypothetical protein VW29_12595 [Devosia limi DSM 17137]